jgi:hypothetical protein
MQDDAAIGMLCPLAIAAVVLILMIVVWWRIFDKTGHGGAMSLLMLLPIINIIMLLVLAFGEWPVEAEVRRLRRALADREDYGGGGRGYGGDQPRPPRGGDDYGYTR